ncbi:hypothetical protein MMC30_004996 [Trapelia coarctata]|nr:hypothetical protein [Trapelia coarctata]
MKSTPTLDGSQPPPLSVVQSALTAGALSGASGLVFGSVAGIIRSPHPIIFAVAAGAQWFALGTTFWGTRAVILDSRSNQEISPRQKIYISGISGGLSGGAVAALTRGRSNIIPGTIVFSILGSLGQATHNSFDASHTQALASSTAEPPTSLLQRLASKKWIPMKVLTDEEYESMLSEKLLTVEAEMAVIDEEIGRLRDEGKRGVSADAESPAGKN